MSEFDLEAAMPEVLRAFYARVRDDNKLGPIFNAAIEDWDEHIDRIDDFWSSVMLGTGRYKGDPVARHLQHAAKIDRDKFERWLELWRETTDDLLPGPLAEALQAKAARIAESLQLAIQFATTAQRVVRDGREREL